MATVQVRYIVHDVDAAVALYTSQLGFKVEMRPAPPFAMLSRGDLRLVLSAPSPMGGGGQAMPDGTKPTPGGWNRFAIEVAILAGMVRRCARPALISATTSSPASAARRSSSTILPAMRSSFSSRHCARLAWGQADPARRYRRSRAPSSLKLGSIAHRAVATGDPRRGARRVRRGRLWRLHHRIGRSPRRGRQVDDLSILA